MRSILNITAALLLLPTVSQAEDKGPPWLQANAYAIPKETNNQGSGYFSIVTGLDGKLYIGTAKYGENSYLVEFDPKTKKMKVVVDTHKEIGTNLKGFGAQSKIHTRNNVGKSGKIYFGTKQGYPDLSKGEKREDYPGGYPMVYDPKTGKTKVYPIPIKHQGIISITPDEDRGVAYISTCSDGHPGPGENAHFMILDLKTEKYRDLIDTKHIFGFIVVDYLGRAYHPMLGGGIVRYDPKTDTILHLKQTIDGKEPTKESNLGNSDVTVSVQKNPSPNSSAPLYQTQVYYPTGHPINWDISPDGKTLYSLPMSTNQLYAYDLTATGDTLPGRSLGVLVPEAKAVDCRAMCVGPKGDVWAAVTVPDKAGNAINHLVSYHPGDKAAKLHGRVAIANPNYTEFVDKAGKPLPLHYGVVKLPDGTTTTKFVILGVAQGLDGSVYSLSLVPHTLLEVPPAQLK
jgi:hypothetical protein